MGGIISAILGVVLVPVLIILAHIGTLFIRPMLGTIFGNAMIAYIGLNSILSGMIMSMFWGWGIIPRMLTTVGFAILLIMFVIKFIKSRKKKRASGAVQPEQAEDINQAPSMGGLRSNRTSVFTKNQNTDDLM